MAARSPGFRVSYPNGGYRTFSTFEVWNAYLLAVEKMGKKWVLLADCTALVLM